MKLLSKALRRAITFEHHYFVIMVDEYENYADYQQCIVNTRVKQSRREDGVTYRLFLRSGGLRTRETLAPGQLIEETHDYRLHTLDEGMVFADFKKYTLAVANRHLEQHPYFREHGLTRLQDILEELSPRKRRVCWPRESGIRRYIPGSNGNFRQIVTRFTPDWMKSVSPCGKRPPSW